MLELIISVVLIILGILFILAVFGLIYKIIGAIWWAIMGGVMLFIIAYGFHLI